MDITVYIVEKNNHYSVYKVGNKRPSKVFVELSEAYEYISENHFTLDDGGQGKLFETGEISPENSIEYPKIEVNALNNQGALKHDDTDHLYNAIASEGLLGEECYYGLEKTDCEGLCQGTTEPKKSLWKRLISWAGF